MAYIRCYNKVKHQPALYAIVLYLFYNHIRHISIHSPISVYINESAFSFVHYIYHLCLLFIYYYNIFHTHESRYYNSCNLPKNGEKRNTNENIFIQIHFSSEILASSSVTTPSVTIKTKILFFSLT